MASPDASFAINRELLLQSGLFDESYYLGQAGTEAGGDPAGHYLLSGWRMGLEPNPSFPGTQLQPYFASFGFHQPPAITWLVQRSAGWPIPASWSELQSLAASIRATGLFDDAFYAGQLGEAADRLDPAIHYIVAGERIGIAPSAHFDPAFYFDFYPDVAQAQGLIGLLHYFHHGRAEGRLAATHPHSVTGHVIEDQAKENVILVVHEASRTGAPVLGWNIARQLAKRYNLYTICLGDGELKADFAAASVALHGPFPDHCRYSAPYIGNVINRLLNSRKFRYAIVNSAESRSVVPFCARGFVPTVMLMHEFASYVLPRASLRQAFELATEIIFPARVVADAAKSRFPFLHGRATHILAQGASVLPERKESAPKTPAKKVPNKGLDKLTREHDQQGTFIVLGAGHVQIRKGVDLFIAVAAAVAQAQPARSIHFLWVGHGYRPEEDVAYSAYLYEQLERSGVEARVTFLDAVLDLEPVYRIADTFLLSSRLDPFPNVAMDAMERGIPLVCFKEASGTADLLLSDPETSAAVVGYFDVDAAARVVLQLASDEPLRARMSEATRCLALNSFLAMETYVAQLDVIGTQAAVRMQQQSADAQTLLAGSDFDQNMFLGLDAAVETRADSITRYLASSYAYGENFMDIRRPAPGFQRPLYAAEHRAFLSNGTDPFADFIRKGKPAGPWMPPVLRPDDPDIEIRPASQVRAALHAHFYYPELALDFLSRLQGNRSLCDLLISTDTTAKAEQLRHLLSPHPGKVDIRVVPNKGRDIGPLLSEFAMDLESYEVIGHVHSKRSLILEDQNSGENWRHFLWQNLLGGKYPMLDRILAAFASQPDLGLVFPSDPHIRSWEDNREPAAELAARMGWTGPLPDHFDYPLGTMFWMRRAALRPLLDLHLDWDDYPAEPVPYDGTMLHAIERLLPMVCQLAGFTSAVTHVFGVTW